MSLYSVHITLPSITKGRAGQGYNLWLLVVYFCPATIHASSTTSLGFTLLVCSYHFIVYPQEVKGINMHHSKMYRLYGNGLKYIEVLLVSYVIYFGFSSLKAI